eukprot:jgi/Tetstr1/424616/TSEL_015138.t1
MDATRSSCPLCAKTRQYYCYDCILTLTPGVPRLRLPVKVDVVQHGEINSKGTGLHAALLAPDDVRLIRHADGTSTHRRTHVHDLNLPEYPPSTTAILFPARQDTPVVGAADCPQFERIIVLDGNWKKAASLLMHNALAGLPCVQLPENVRTTYWRRGTGEFKGARDEGVCSIEAIHVLCGLLDPDHQYDDLLWYYEYIRRIVERKGVQIAA